MFGSKESDCRAQRLNFWTHYSFGWLLAQRNHIQAQWMQKNTTFQFIHLEPMVFEIITNVSPVHMVQCVLLVWILFIFSLPFWIPPESTNAIYKHSNTTLGTSNDTSIFVMNRILCFWNGNDYARRARLKSQKSIQWDEMKWISTNHFQMVYFYRLLGVSVFTFDSVDRYQTSKKACFWFWCACYSIYRHHGLFSLCVLQTLALL